MLIWASLLHAVERMERAALVSVVRVFGSAPREAGARMVVTADETIGTIGGGCLEWQAARTARRRLSEAAGEALLQTRILGPDLGQCCGGRIEIATEVFGVADRPFLARMAAREFHGEVEPVAEMRGDRDQCLRAGGGQSFGDHAASDVEAILLDPGLCGVGAEDVERDREAVRWQLHMHVAPHPVEHQPAGLEPRPFDEAQPRMTGCHQPCEIVTGTEIPVAWFAYGLRIIDFSNPHSLKEVAHFLPDVPPGSDRVQSNDVTVDDRGLMYLLDRVRGLHILERT